MVRERQGGSYTMPLTQGLFRAIWLKDSPRILTWQSLEYTLTWRNILRWFGYVKDKYHAPVFQPYHHTHSPQWVNKRHCKLPLVHPECLMSATTRAVKLQLIVNTLHSLWENYWPNRYSTSHSTWASGKLLYPESSLYLYSNDIVRL